MLQINREKNGIRPHYWANGGYIVQEPNISGLEFDAPIEEGKWYKLEINVDKDIVSIKISKSGKIIIDKQWDIRPTQLSFPVREPDNKDVQIGMLDIRKDYSYGTIGFRDGHGEKALVRKLLIKKI